MVGINPFLLDKSQFGEPFIDASGLEHPELMMR
jgi:hypothetical protein